MLDARRNPRREARSEPTDRAAAAGSSRALSPTLLPITRADVMTVADVAALLDLKPYTVKEYARRGILPGRKLGRGWRFLRPELEDAIRQLPRPPS
jgi:excisionase family DNA binding protein